MKIPLLLNKSHLNILSKVSVVFDLDVIYRLGSIYKEKLVKISYFFKGTDEGSISMRLPDIRHDGFPFQINQITKAHSLTDAT